MVCALVAERACESEKAAACGQQPATKVCWSRERGRALTVAVTPSNKTSQRCVGWGLGAALALAMPQPWLAGPPCVCNMGIHMAAVWQMRVRTLVQERHHCEVSEELQHR